jgi:hypothetical protein
MADDTVGKGSKEQIAFEMMTFIARTFEGDPYDARDYTLRLYEECLQAMQTAESGQSVAFELVKAISSSGKDPQRGTKPDRKYVLALFEECLRSVRGESARPASAPSSTPSSTPSSSTPGKRTPPAQNPRAW